MTLTADNFYGPITEACYDQRPFWMLKAVDCLGIKEIKGAEHHARIVGFWRSIRSAFRNDETPWCAAFVGAMLEDSGITSTRSAAARSYTKWGKKLSGPAVGAVVVFWRGSRHGWSGHVGFVAGRNQNGHIVVLGGNQKDQVNYMAFDNDRLLGYYYPKKFDAKVVNFYDLPLIETSGGVSTNEA